MLVLIRSLYLYSLSNISGNNDRMMKKECMTARVTVNSIVTRNLMYGDHMLLRTQIIWMNLMHDITLCVVLLYCVF